MLGLGAMSVYTGTWKSDVMSWVRLLLTVSIFIVPAFIMLLEGMQWPSINQSPGSWCVDIFLDHHGAGGTSPVRYHMGSSPMDLVFPCGSFPMFHLCKLLPMQKLFGGMWLTASTTWSTRGPRWASCSPHPLGGAKLCPELRAGYLQTLGGGMWSQNGAFRSSSGPSNGAFGGKCAPLPPQSCF